MGGKQSKVETSDAQTELHSNNEQDSEVKTSISMTPALRDQIVRLQQGVDAPASNNGQARDPNDNNQPHVITPEQETSYKEALRHAYLKGVEDAKKQLEVDQKKASQIDSVQKAQRAKEQESKEDARVKQLVKEMNQKTYRAPLNDVQCSQEREACLQCYRDKQSDLLKCKEVADAFTRCAQQTTEKFVKAS